jgi:hypothetical protein
LKIRVEYFFRNWFFYSLDVDARADVDMENVGRRIPRLLLSIAGIVVSLRWAAGIATGTDC